MIQIYFFMLSIHWQVVGVALQIWKTLETTDNALLEIITLKDYDVSLLFQDDCQQPPRSPLEHDKRRADRLETEEFYLNVSLPGGLVSFIWLSTDCQMSFEIIVICNDNHRFWLLHDMYTFACLAWRV